MRVSRHRRIDRIENYFEPPGSLARALRRLSPEMREQYRIWRERTDRIHGELKNRGVNAYEAAMNDPLLFPAMPKSIEYALWPHRRDVDEALVRGDYSEAYSIMLQGDET